MKIIIKINYFEYFFYSEVIYVLYVCVKNLSGVQTILERHLAKHNNPLNNKQMKEM